jgi:hypothetical protein
VHHAATLADRLDAALDAKEAAEKARADRNTLPHPTVKIGEEEARPSLMDLIRRAWLRDTTRRGLVPVEWALSPLEIVAILNTLARPLVLILILGLVTLSLQFDRLELRHDLSETIRASHDMWVLVLGALCSAMVAAVYLPAISRLSLYAEAEEDLKSPGGSNGWRISRDGDGSARGWLVDPRAPATPTPYEGGLIRYVGADRAKMRIMIHTRHFAGGFHILLQQNLTKQIQTVLGLLAPAAAGAILNLI